MRESLEGAKRDEWWCFCGLWPPGIGILSPCSPWHLHSDDWVSSYQAAVAVSPYGIPGHPLGIPHFLAEQRYSSEFDWMNQDDLSHILEWQAKLKLIIIITLFFLSPWSFQKCILEGMEIFLPPVQRRICWHASLTTGHKSSFPAVGEREQASFHPWVTSARKIPNCSAAFSVWVDVLSRDGSWPWEVLREQCVTALSHLVRPFPPSLIMERVRLPSWSIWNCRCQILGSAIKLAEHCNYCQPWVSLYVRVHMWVWAHVWVCMLMCVCAHKCVCVCESVCAFTCGDQRSHCPVFSLIRLHCTFLRQDFWASLGSPARMFDWPASPRDPSTCLLVLQLQICATMWVLGVKLRSSSLIDTHLTDRFPQPPSF